MLLRFALEKVKIMNEIFANIRITFRLTESDQTKAPFSVLK